MRRLVLLFPLLVACSDYWTGTFDGRFTVSTNCPPSAPIAEDDSGSLVMAENEELDDTVNVTVLTSVNDASGRLISGSQCIGLMAKSDSDEASLLTLQCPKGESDDIARTVTGGRMTIDGNKVTFSMTVESPNAAEGATGACVQTYTGQFDRSSYRTNYY